MLVTVVIPAFNAAGHIAEAVASALLDRDLVKEVIVVDDGSKDTTAGVAESLDPLVRVIRQRNSGASVARNAAVAESTGQFVAFLDSDDVWKPGKLRMQLAYLASNADAVAVASGFEIFDWRGTIANIRWADGDVRRLTAMDFVTSPRVHPSSLLVRGAIARLTPFPVGIAHCEDVIYASLLRMRGVIGSVDSILLRRRQHAGQLTRTSGHFSTSLALRLQWAMTHCAELGVGSPETVRKAILTEAVNDVRVYWWKRDLPRYRELLEELRRVWPVDVPQPRVFRQKIPPGWLLSLWDRLPRSGLTMDQSNGKGER